MRDADISVVLPTRDRPSLLVHCLDGLARQGCGDDLLEVLVIDDGGAADLERVVHAHGAGLDVVLLRTPNRGPAAARNLGAERARGALLAFVDDDVIPDPGWASALLEAHRDRPGDALGGGTTVLDAGNPYASAADLIVRLAYDHYNGGAPGSARFFASSNLAFPAARFRELGGFDPRLRASEDRELCDRWVERGWRMTYVPTASVRHRYPATMREFWSRHYGYGRGAFAYHRARARRGHGLDGLDGSFHLRALRIGARRAAAERSARPLVLLGAWQAANTAGFVSEAIAHTVRRSPARGTRST